MPTKNKPSNPVSEDAIMEVIEGWRDEEVSIRESLPVLCFGIHKEQLAAANQLRTCRMKLAIATGLDADPGKE